MTLNLSHLERRIKELESLADEVFDLAQNASQGEYVQPDLSVKGQRWYRGARQLLVQQNFSGLKEFDHCYNATSMQVKNRVVGIGEYVREDIYFLDPEERDKRFKGFSRYFTTARALLLSLVEEINSRELPVKTELSFHVSANEFETAKGIFDQYSNEEVPLRVSGIVARVALERHIRTGADTTDIEHLTFVFF